MTASDAGLPEPSAFDGTCIHCGSSDLTLTWEYRYAANPTGLVPGATGANPFSLAGVQTKTIATRQPWPTLQCNGCDHRSEGVPT